MGCCGSRETPKTSVLEINDDVVRSEAESLVEQKKYEVHVDTQEETLVSLAANMQAMRENIRLKNKMHMNKLQKIRASKSFSGFLALVKKKLPAEAQPHSDSSPVQES